MKVHASGLLTAVVAGAALLGAIVLANGCGGIDCTETATCPNLDDGSSEQSAKEGGDAPGMEAAPLAAEAGPDGSDTGQDDATDDVTLDASDEDATVDDSDDSDAMLDAPDAADADEADAKDASDAADAPDAADAADRADAADAATCGSGSSCVQTAPSGWFGPGAFYDGVFTTMPPPCVAPFGNNSFNAFSTLNVPVPPSPPCACACGAAVTGGCSLPALTVFGDNQCINPCGSAGVPTCKVTTGPSCTVGGNSVGVKTQPTPTGAGSCSASPPVQTGSFPASNWTRSGEACEASSPLSPAGCSAGSVCAENPPSGFRPMLCVWTKADTNCLQTPGYTLLYKYYASLIDTRACGAGTCGCNPATVTACTLTSATAFTAPDCSSGASPMTDLATLVGSGGGAMHCNKISSIEAMTAAVTTTGSCGAKGMAALTGGVTPDTTTAVTVCCAQ